MRRLFGSLPVLAGLLLGLCGAPSAQEQPFPTRHVTIVVRFAPGGPSDGATRIVADHMSATLGQQFVVENVGGAGGMIGASRVARAAPDGHTLLVHQLALAASVSLYPKLGFDPAKDLASIGLLATSPVIIVGRRSLPATTVAELGAWMKAQNGAVRFAHAGPGSMAHLCAAVFAQAMGASVDMIPYRGGGPAVADVIAGHVDLFCSGLATAAGHVRAGTMKGFGVSTREPLAAVPEVPSLVQLGYSDLEIQHWHGLFAPAGTPRSVVEKLNGALRAALADPKVVKAFADSGTAVFPEPERTPEAAHAFLRTEIQRWGEVIRRGKIEVSQ